ncbi:hypothetical protein [Agromyces silvae]|uniref:hypothetical protein n=1 Tax=Agromyces silvae TaxID=3388266 RepID=UPI00280B9566|nr:hypothetical protein [Agromyces protaetiae]
MMTQTMAPAPIAPKSAPTLTHARVRATQTAAAPTPAAARPIAQHAQAPSRATDERVELVHLDDATWRVCDSTATPGQRGYIVGYLQACGTEFEMLWMHPRPGVVHQYDDFDSALRAIATRLSMFPG